MQLPTTNSSTSRAASAASTASPPSSSIPKPPTPTSHPIPTEAVLAVFGPAIFIAAIFDLGLPIPLPAHLPSTLRALIESARIFLAEGDVPANRLEADNRLAEALSALTASYPLPITTSAI